MSTLLPPPQTAGALPEAPHELVLAAAGAGKTFHLSSRIIALLAHGAPPEQVLASTFTRKAAGEILDRVLKRIALAARSEKEAGELSKHASLEGGEPLSRDSAAWAELLGGVVRRLHRMNVGTLDAYFVGAARTFAHELELPPGWGIADETRIRRLRSEALQQVLAGAGDLEMVELLRLAQGGDVRRSVHDQILDDLDELLEIHEALDPRVPDPWGAFAADTPPLSPAERARIAEAIRGIEVPVNRDGSPKKSWRGALLQAADAVEAGDWPGLLSSGICRKILEGEPSFDRVALPEPVLAAFREGLDLAAAALRPQLARQIRALGELTGRYATALATLQYRSGAYRFGDLTRLVGGAEPLLGREELYYRLDAVARHLLLDEFQDTSRAQWEALQPLFDEAV
jgi:ATP-dependent helicase/nuclease subunit A